MMNTTLDFSIDWRKVEAVGTVPPHSIEAMEAYNRYGLSSAERLYCQLIGDLALETGAYKPGTRLCEAGQPVTHAYVVRQGELDIRTRDSVFRVGPGAVLGLAAGLAQQVHDISATTATVVTASVLPMHKAVRAFNSCHPGLRGINRNTVMRILGLTDAPQSLK